MFCARLSYVYNSVQMLDLFMYNTGYAEKIAIKLSDSIKLTSI